MNHCSNLTRRTLLILLCFSTTDLVLSTGGHVPENVHAFPRFIDHEHDSFSITPAENQLRRFSLYTDIDILSENSGATTITVTAELDGGLAFTAAQTITVTVTGSGVSSAVDFTPVSTFDIVIPANERSGSATFTLIPEDDTVDEENETITISSTSSLVTGTDSISLLDDDPAPTGISLSRNPFVAHEDGGAQRFTVTATVNGSTTYGAVQSLPITVEGTLVATAVDFVAVPDFTIEIPGGAQSGSASFTLTPINDSVDETAETIMVSSSSSLVTNSFTFLLQDDDFPPRGINIRVSPNVAYEDLGEQEIEVFLDIFGFTTYATDQIIPLTVTGTGTAGVVGFSPVANFNVTLPAESSETSSTFTITPRNNLIDEKNERITISSSASQITGSATINLIDDDVPPENIRLSARPSVIEEGDGPTSVTVTATIGNQTTFAQSTSIPITVSGSENAGVVEFSSVSGFSITFPPNESIGTATLIITPFDDDEVNDDEVITLLSTNSSVINSATITLVNNDADPMIDLSVVPNSISENDGPTTITVTATIENSQTPAQDLEIPIAVTGSGKDDAVDFVPVPDFNLILNAGMLTGSTIFTLSPIDDFQDESDEIITIASNIRLVTQNATVSIIDDDDPAEIQISLNPETIYEERGVQKVAVIGTITNGSAFSQDHSVPVLTRGSGKPDAVDFEPITDAFLLFKPGDLESAITLDITPVDDQESESNETITIFSTDEHVKAPVDLLLINDDIEPDGVLLSVSPSTIREDAGATNVTITGTVQGNTRYAVRQTILIDITADNNPNSVAFQSVQRIALTIPEGASEGKIEFEILPQDNTSYQPNGIVTVSSASELVSGIAEIILENDDAPPTGVILAVSPSSISESDGTTPLSIEATIEGGTTFITENILVISVEESSETAAVDFTPIPDFELIIPAESSSASVVIELTPEDDLQDEQDEIVTFSTPLVPLPVTLKIVDDDAEPEGITVSLDPTEISEDAGKTDVTVTVHVNGSTRYATDRLLNLMSADSGMPNVVRYALTGPTNLLLPAGQERASTTIIVQPEDNVLDEGDETLTITISDDHIKSSANLSLIDDDAEPGEFVLAVSPEIVTEGDGSTIINVTASITGTTRYTSVQTLTFSVSEMAEGGVQFRSVPDFAIEVPAGADAGNGSFTLTPIENTIPESDATIVISASHKGMNIRATILLQDDDQPTNRIADVNVNLLPEVTRAIIASSVGAVSERIQTYRGRPSNRQRSDFSSGLSRIAMRLQNDKRYWHPLESTSISQFKNASLATSLIKRITLWGHADYRALSGNGINDLVDYDGGITAIYVGVDLSFDDFLAGVSIAQFGGDLSYEHRGGANRRALTTPVRGDYQISTRTLTPYVTWSWNPRSKIWAMGSLGSGDVEISDPETTVEETNTSLIAYAAGVDLKLIQARNDFSLAVKGAVWGGQMNLDENSSRISELDADVYRFLTSLEGAYQIHLPDQGLFQPFVETGLRGDLGDGQTGAGLEMGGGVRLSVPSMGLRITGRGHVLVLHGKNINEWGFGGVLSFAPHGNSGPALELRSTTGDHLQNALEIWQDTRWESRSRYMDRNTRIQSRLSYGFVTKNGIVKPYTGVDLSYGIITQMGAAYRIGERINIQLETVYPIHSHIPGSSPTIRSSIILR